MQRANASQQQGNGVNASGNDSADSEGGEGDDSDVCSGDEDRGTGQYEAMRAKAAMHTGECVTHIALHRNRHGDAYSLTALCQLVIASHKPALLEPVHV